MNSTVVGVLDIKRPRNMQENRNIVTMNHGFPLTQSLVTNHSATRLEKPVSFIAKLMIRHEQMNGVNQFPQESLITSSQVTIPLKPIKPIPIKLGQDILQLVHRYSVKIKTPKTSMPCRVITPMGGRKHLNMIYMLKAIAMWNVESLI